MKTTKTSKEKRGSLFYEIQEKFHLRDFDRGENLI